LLLDLARTIRSEAFAQSARHPEAPRAFTRQRQLPLPALIATLLCMRASSQQCLLDSVFGAMRGVADMVRGVSDRAFAKARSHLHMSALAALNDRVLAQAESAGMLPRWQGLRLVAADASVLIPAIRQCRRTKGLAAADQRLFALYLPGAELTLHAAVHSASEAERAMLANALDKLGPDDVLLLDRGVRFIIRCDTTSGGWRSVRQFIRGDQHEATITLPSPKAQDVADWGCSAQRPSVRAYCRLAHPAARMAQAARRRRHRQPAERDPGNDRAQPATTPARPHLATPQCQIQAPAVYGLQGVTWLKFGALPRRGPLTAWAQARGMQSMKL